MFKHYLLLIVIVCLQLYLFGQVPSGNITLASQAEVDDFVANYPNTRIIEGDLFIGNPEESSDIEDLSGLSNLASVRGDLYISDNSSLTSLTGLENITLIGRNILERGKLYIRRNSSLTSIEGIKNLVQQKISELWLHDNPLLAVCAVENICGALSRCDRFFAIYNNAIGCNSKAEVMAACIDLLEITYSGPVGLPINLDPGSKVIDLQLSADGNHLFMSKAQPNNGEFGSRANRSLVLNAYEWNGIDWVDQGQSRDLYPIHNDSTREWVVTAFSNSGRYFAFNSAIQYEHVSFGLPLVFRWIDGNNWEPIEPFQSRGSHHLSLSNDGRFYRSLDYFNELSADGSQLAIDIPELINPPSAGGRLRMHEWNGTDWEFAPQEDVSLGQSIFLDFDSSGNHLICWYENQLKYYERNGSSWELLSSIDADIEDQWQLSDDGKRLCSNDKLKLFYWDGMSWNESRLSVVANCSDQSTEFSFSGDGRRVAVAVASEVLVYDVEPNGFAYQFPALCVSSEARTFEQAVYPAGGTFSGSGVSTGPTGDSFVFDPMVAGMGTHIITYHLEEEIYYDSITVIPSVAPTLNLPDTVRIASPGLRYIPGMGIPEGGVYEDNLDLLTDDGNGITFSLSQLQASEEITITYTIVNENDCTVSSSKTLTLINESPNQGRVYANQVGEDIYDLEAIGALGSSVSLSDDGTRMAVGNPNKELGEVYVYHLLEDQWVQMARLLPSRYHGRFGRSVALSGDGNRLIVGDPGYHFYRQLPLSKYDIHPMSVYEWNGSEWNFLGTRYGERAYSNLFYGSGLGTEDGDVVDISRDGKVIGVGWFICREIDSAFICDMELPMGNSTITLSADGNRIAISPFTRGAQLDTTLILVYDWDGEDWIQVGDSIVELALRDRANISLDISADGRRIVIGNLQRQLSDDFRSVKVYEWNGLDWELLGSPINDRNENEEFGKSVTLTSNGNKLLIGSPNYENDSGRAYIYNWEGIDWQLEEEIVLVGGDQADDEFGFAIDASLYGEVIAVGAPQRTNSIAGGYVRVFGTDCRAPSTVTVSDVSETSAVINWDQIGEESLFWELELLESGQMPSGQPTYNNIEDWVLNLDGLKRATSYAVYVRSICTNDTSIWAGPISFTTPGILIEGGIRYSPNDLIGEDPDNRPWINPIRARVGRESNVPEQVIGLELSPNPTSNQVRLALQLTELEKIQLSLYDVYGQRLLLEPVVEAQNWTQEVDLSAYPEGTYLLYVRIGEQSLTRRVVKLE